MPSSKIADIKESVNKKIIIKLNNILLRSYIINYFNFLRIASKIRNCWRQWQQITADRVGDHKHHVTKFLFKILSATIQVFQCN